MKAPAGPARKQPTQVGHQVQVPAEGRRMASWVMQAAALPGWVP